MNTNPKNTWSSPLRLALVTGLTFCALAPAQAQSLMTTNGEFLAWPETEVPGLPGVYFGGSVQWPTQAEDGTFFFQSDMVGAGVTGANYKGVFSGTNAADLSMVARWSGPAPGLPGLSLINRTCTGGMNDGTSCTSDGDCTPLPPPAAAPRCATGTGVGSNALISPSGGYKVWSSFLNGAGVSTTNDTALFRSSPGGSVLIAREGTAAPGTTGALFSGNLSSQYQFTQVNRNGTVLFQSSLAGGDVTGANNGAIFTGTPGALSILRRLGDTVLPGPVTAAGMGTIQQMDNNGRVLYDVTLAGAGVTTDNNRSLWFYTPGSGSTLLVREGSPAPGTAGATFGNPDPLPPQPQDDNWFPGCPATSLTRSGKYTLASYLEGGDVIYGVNDNALYVGTVGGGLTMIARAGDPAPGTDAVFQGFSPWYSLINDAGDVAFQATLTGGSSDPTNNSGIWTWKSGTLSLVVRSGAPVPGFPPVPDVPVPVTTYDTFIGWNMSFNDLGQILVHGHLLGGETRGTVDASELLVFDPTKGLIVVARSGEEVEGAPGSIRTLKGAGFLQYSNTDGVSHALGITGRVALFAYFNEGQAIATVDLDCHPATAYGIDVDGDGFGDASTRVSVCSGETPPGGYIPNATDCNDGDPGVYKAYYQDTDEDGRGDRFASVCAGATPPAGYVIKSNDCDDTQPTVYPGALETCDGLDNNCDFQIDEGFEDPMPSTCGVGACLRGGIFECVGGVPTDSCVPGPPGTETCNFIDDDCDGTVDNAAVPTGTPAVALAKLGVGTARLTWPAVAAATGYDLVTGGLQALRSSGGNFSTATTQCLADDLPATSFDDAAIPALGQGFFYLIRAVNCGGGNSYNSGSPSQIGLRDAEIAASGHACP